MSFLNLSRQTRQASIRRLVLSVLKLILLWLTSTFLLFILLNILPGDAASSQAGKAGEEAVRLLRHEMGLDQSVYLRYLQWLTGLCCGNLGRTYVTGKAVLDVISIPVRSSLIVTGIVLLALILLTLPLAVCCGYYKNIWTRSVNKLFVILASIPEFILTILLLIFLALRWRLLPVLSTPGPGERVWTVPVSLVMPSLCLWSVCSVSMFRHLRVMIEAHARSACIREARLAGLSATRVLFIHLLPSALAGIAQLFASTVPYLLGGSMIAESITSFPGMGYTLVMAVQSRETLVVMALGGLMILIALLSYRLADCLGQSRNGSERS